MWFAAGSRSNAQGNHDSQQGELNFGTNHKHKTVSTARQRCWDCYKNKFFLVHLQAHCPIYLVNVSSMSAGDVVASAKMQG